MLLLCQHPSLRIDKTNWQKLLLGDAIAFGVVTAAGNGCWQARPVCGGAVSALWVNSCELVLELPNFRQQQAMCIMLVVEGENICCDVAIRAFWAHGTSHASLFCCYAAGARVQLYIKAW